MLFVAPPQLSELRSHRLFLGPHLAPKHWVPLTTKPCRQVSWYGMCEHPLEQEVMANVSGYWWPLGVLFWLAARVENLLGWAFGLMFVAIVSGWIKKD